MSAKKQTSLQKKSNKSAKKQTSLQKNVSSLQKAKKELIEDIFFN